MSQRSPITKWRAVHPLLAMPSGEGEGSLPIVESAEAAAIPAELVERIAAGPGPDSFFLAARRRARASGLLPASPAPATAGEMRRFSRRPRRSGRSQRFGLGARFGDLERKAVGAGMATPRRGFWPSKGQT